MILCQIVIENRQNANYCKIFEHLKCFSPIVKAMQARLVAGSFQEFIKALNVHNLTGGSDEITIETTPNGLEYKFVDSAHIVMIHCKLQAFESYSGKETTRYCYDIPKMEQILKLARPDQQIDFGIYNRNDRNRARFIIDNLYRECDITMANAWPKMPNINLPNYVVVSVEELRRACKAASSISDHIAIRCEENSFLIKAEGETDEVTVDFSSEYLKQIKCVDSPVKSAYSLEYVTSLIDGIPKSTADVKLSFGSEQPIRLEYELSKVKIGDRQSSGNVTCLLAPRVEGY